MANPRSEIQIEADEGLNIQIGPLETAKKSGGYISYRVLKVPRDKRLHNKNIRCVEAWYDFENSFFRQKVSKTLQIEHAPTGIEMKFNDGEGRPKVGKNSVQCKVVNGYPLVRKEDISFSLGGSLLSAEFVEGAENIFIIKDLYLTKEDHGKVLECRISHPRLTPDGMAHRSQVQVEYAPTKVEFDLGRTEFKTGEEINFTVSADASFPASEIVCTKKLFNGSTEHLKNVSQEEKDVQPYGSKSSKSFSLKTTNLDDGAEIVCSIDGMSSISSKARISVLTEPIFLEHKVFSVKEGEKFKLDLDLVVRSNPPVKNVQWRRVQPKSKRLKITKENSKKFLVLDEVTAGMSGEYFVETEGVSGTILLQVLTRPKLFITGEAKYVVGEQLALVCQCSGDPAPAIYWKKGDEIISNSSELLIPNVSRAQAGKYFCFGHNSHSLVAQEIEVEVMFAPIIVSAHPRIVAYDLETELEFACSVNAYPPVENVLFVNPLGHASDAQWNGQKWTKTLDIQLKSATFGKWKCVAANQVGKSEYSFDVVEAGRPDKVAQIRLQNRTETSVVLRWTKGFDNGFEQKFRVFLKSEGETVKLATFSESVRLNNLTQSKEYVATVLAENEKGRSIPVEIHFNMKEVENGAIPTVFVYLICFSILTLAIIVTLVVCNRKRELIYQTKSKPRLLEIQNY